MSTPSTPLSLVAPHGEILTGEALADFAARACAAESFRGQRVLLIVPDSTRTAPIAPVFQSIHRQLSPAVAALDVLVALGTHAPMSEEAICTRLGISSNDRRSVYANVRLFNHEWDNSAALTRVGALTPSEVGEISQGRFSMEVPVTVNRRLLDYDHVVLIGPVFPHEVAGFSGGNKYLFPGVSGPEVLNFFHWLAALVTNVEIIGRKWTPVRQVIDRAASLVPVARSCLALVAERDGAAGAYYGTPEAAWSLAADLAATRHILWKPRPYRLILSCASTLYEELWTGAKAMYKLEPILGDGGELIIYAPQIREVSHTHGRYIEQIGYHCRDYFLAQWPKFQEIPWGVLAHCTHVFGGGTYADGLETPRAKVTLATSIPEATCKQVNLGYLDYRKIAPEDYEGREQEGILVARRAGETLYRLG